ncbi:MAG: hypothetical protein JST90_14290 [Bacteroidetes bacterium]|nr:hypothetical protein [Bacteroidota bacterium]
MIQDTAGENEKKSKRLRWLKRSGIAVFLFFLLKGLAWLALGAAVWMGIIAKD